MNNLWKEIRFKLTQTNSKLGLLIGINVVLFLLIFIPGTFEKLSLRSETIFDFVDKYLHLPAHFPTLLVRPWTLLTYMFMHTGALHILYNMVWLYWFGQIFEEFLGTRRIVWLYLLGGLAGAIFFLAGMNLTPLFKGETIFITVAGASASVMAVVVATAALAPNYEVFLMFIGPVKLKWLAIGFVIMDYLGTIGPNAGGEMAHLGGALLGFIYIKQLQKGNDWNKPVSKVFAPKPTLKVIRGGVNDGKPMPPTQDEIDRILDKISQRGESSLTKSEKETLQRASQ